MILIDTSAIFAVLDKNDIYHFQAAIFWQELVRKDEEIFLNSNLLLEAIALIQRRYGMDILRQFHFGMIPLLKIEWINVEKHSHAMEFLLSTNRRHLSLVDISAFATMRRLGIKKVFTFDQHFAEQGFDLFPAP